MPLLIELAILAGFLTLGLILGTLWARRIKPDDSEEKRRAEDVHARSEEIKQSAKKDRQALWIESWERRATRR